jgi:caa(3)-type oxidase subunit IV
VERDGLKYALRLGLALIIALGVLTVIEFVVPVALERGPALPILVVLALVKAGLIVYYFMHLAQLWRREKV